MTSADIVKFHALSNVIEDAGNFAILVKSGSHVPKKLVVEMKEHYDEVRSFTRGLIGHEEYVESIEAVRRGEVLAAKCAENIFEFQKSLVNYRATC